MMFHDALPRFESLTRFEHRWNRQKSWMTWMTLTSGGGWIGAFWDFEESFIECGYFMLFPNKRGGPVGGRSSFNHEIRIVFQKYDLLTSCRHISWCGSRGWLKYCLKKVFGSLLKDSLGFWNIQDGSQLLRMSLRMSAQRLLRFVGTLVVSSLFIHVYPINSWRSWRLLHLGGSPPVVHRRAAAILCSVNSGASMPKKCRILLAKSLVTQTTNPIMNPAELAVYFERQLQNSTFHIVLGSYIYSACELAPLYAVCLHFIFVSTVGALFLSSPVAVFRPWQLCEMVRSEISLVDEHHQFDHHGPVEMPKDQVAMAQSFLAMGCSWNVTHFSFSRWAKASGKMSKNIQLGSAFPMVFLNQVTWWLYWVTVQQPESSPPKKTYSDYYTPGFLCEDGRL